MAHHQDIYVPPPEGGEWARIAPQDAGFDSGRLDEAVSFALGHDSDFPSSLYHPDGRYAGTAYVGESGPWSAVVGPVRPRGGPAGLILKGGRIVAEWGDTSRADMTFSIAKSYIAAIAGLAVADGLIADLDERVGRRVPGECFASPHNAEITWRHLLQQTSEWDGTLWGKPDAVDRNRQVGVSFDNSRKGEHRDLDPPGTRFEYNDVRVNLLAFALLMVLRRPLPELLRERIMAPIGATSAWEWHGYETSWVEIDGKRVQSVSGGGHWGGGIFIGTRDHARFGLMFARGGRWGGREILPASWVAQCVTPSPCNPGYGFLWWLNNGEARYPGAPASSVFALGGGAHVIWIDPEHDLVTVARWIARGAVDGFMGKVMAAVKA